MAFGPLTSSLRLEPKKPCNFDRNPERGTLSEKEQLKTAENKTAKIQTDQKHMAFGPLTSSFSVERDFRNSPPGVQYFSETDYLH